MKSIFTRLGPQISRKRYRIDENSFYKLHCIFENDREKYSRTRGRTPYEDINSDSCLSQALRWFTRGDP